LLCVVELKRRSVQACGGMSLQVHWRYTDQVY
jgi:hypothetical protein